MRKSPSLHAYSVKVRANSAISFGFSMFLLFLELQILLALDPEPKTQQDVFFSWYLIATSYPDLGKGSSPPEIRPLCVLGDGNGGNHFCHLEASQGLFSCHFDTSRMAVLTVPEEA